AAPVVLLVERIGPPCARVVAPLPQLLAGHPLAGGVSVDQHGAPCLVLDAQRLLALGRLSASSTAGSPADEAGEADAVLVVDDSQTARRAVVDALQAAGIAFDTAADGCEALLKLAARRFAVVLTDLEMPHMDGLTLIAALRRDPRWQSQAVVVCSSRAPAEQAERLRTLQVADYLAKPFDPDALVATVRRLRKAPAEAAL
ncbi:MAG: response regulator, partial [Candidatus Binatia bacterium]